MGFIIDREGRIVVTGFSNADVLSEEDPHDPSGRNLLIMRFTP